LSFNQTKANDMATKPAALKVAPAPAAEPPAAAEASGKSGGKKGKLLIMLLVLLMAGGGGGGWWWWKHQHAANEKDPKQASEKTVAKKTPPQFVPLEQFTVNLQDESTERYLQVGMVLEVSSAEAADAIKLYMPVIRNRILMLLSSKKSTDISHVEGKQKLAETVLAEVRAPLATAGPNKGVEAVHFSSFVIQ
jgi:flagellar FliL protein